VGRLLPWGRSLAFAAATLLGLGLALGNYVHLLLGALLAAHVVLSRRFAPEVRLERAVDGAGEPRGGSILGVRLEGAVAGATVATVHDKLPDGFVLETGSNFRVHTDGILDATFSARLPRRGAFALPPSEVFAPDPAAVAEGALAKAGRETEVAVATAAPTPVDRVRAPTMQGQGLLPDGDRAERGTRTTDFRELRPYAPGDPLRIINWKATARASTREMSLVVNEYEAEGKKSVWIFVDAGAHTASGSSLASTFDHLAEGAEAIATHYIQRGHRVGLTLYGSPAPTLVYPESGSGQRRRVSRALATARPGETSSGLEVGVAATEGFLAREKPLLVVLAPLGRDPGLVAGLARARALAATGRRRPPPPLLVAPRVPVEDTPSGALLAAQEAGERRSLAALGVDVLLWEPDRSPLSALLAGGRR